jgi:cytoskeletal protein RodZ
LTTLFGTNALPTVATVEVPAAPKKRGWLPLLTVLFLISYGLMTMLIVEQGRTIESQRALIRELFRDSTELSAVKQRAAQDSAQAASAKAQAPVTQNPSSQTPQTQAPSTQHPSTQAPASQAPSSQAGPQQQRTQTQSGKQKPDFKMPSKPAADLVDDVRTLITI